jgi:hypothetical protein
MICRHPHALSVTDYDDHPSAELRIKGRLGLDRWCPDCGAIRIWKTHISAVWVRPGEEAAWLRDGKFRHD